MPSKMDCWGISCLAGKLFGQWEHINICLGLFWKSMAVCIFLTQALELDSDHPLKYPGHHCLTIEVTEKCEYSRSF